MKRRAIWIILTCLIVTSMVMASCATSTSTSTPTSTPMSTPTSTPISTLNTVTTTNKATTTTSTTAGNWWDKLGKPQYGGSLTISMHVKINSFDDYVPAGTTEINQAYQDTLTADDWTLDPSVFAFQLNFRPSSYEVGNLGKDWEFTDPNTYVVHLRQGIHWQDIPPVNGREFTADDVVYHYDRLLGLGDGYTTPCPYFLTVTTYVNLISVTAPDKYTVVMKWHNESEESITEKVQGGGADENFEPPEAVQAWGNLNDWHHAIGTGPFILKDYISDSSVTLVKNPNYWAHDERHPQNQLPYIDQLNILIIPEQVTALAGMRTGKIDVLDGILLQDAQNIKKTNPEILQLTYPSATTPTIDPRVDVKPFSDIRVRQAMQKSIDLATIASTYYAGTCPPYPSAMTSMYMTGWNYPYTQWPADLQAQYTYNPTAAKQLLAAAGYPNGFNTDVVASTAADLTLLQVVKSYFAAVGINMSIQTMDQTAWSTFVRGHKPDQLAYGGNSAGFSFPPLMGFNRWQAGAGFTWQNVNDPAWGTLQAKALASSSIADAQQTLVTANKYMAQQNWVISMDTPNYFALYQPWLKGYNAQNFSISGGTGSGSPLWLGFYTARFWIDQGMKTSMGH